jgi:uroporphyrinogen-III synthase
MRNMRLLITRPEEDGGALAERLVALGHEPVLLPLMDIVLRDLPPLPLDGAQALIATSRNALRGLARNAALERARRLPVYCVGEATAAFADTLKFSDIRIGAGTAKDLAPLIARTAKPADGALLYLTAEQIAFDLAGVLSALRFAVRRVIVYSAEENRHAAEALAAQISAGIDGVLLMSPRTAEIFAAAAATIPRDNIRGLTCYCYSQAVAKPLEQTEGLRLSIAARPQEADLLALVGSDGNGAKASTSDELLGKS